MHEQMGRVGLLLYALILLSGALCAQIGFVQQGEASVYAEAFEGRRTASGEPYARQLLTAAHRELPFGSIVRVTRVKTGKQITVCVNDRGPLKEGFVVDLSWRAAEALGLLEPSTLPEANTVRMEVIGLAAAGTCGEWQQTQQLAETFAKKFPPKTTVPTPPPSSKKKTTKAPTVDKKFSSPGTYDVAGKRQKLAGQWGVQVGSFRSLANAQDAAARAKKAGLGKIYLQLPNDSEYRVIVGALKTKEATAKLISSLKKKGFTGTSVPHK
jgi:rare lipoprotein A